MREKERERNHQWSCRSIGGKRFFILRFRILYSFIMSILCKSASHRLNLNFFPHALNVIEKQQNSHHNCSSRQAHSLVLVEELEELCVVVLAHVDAQGPHRAHELLVPHGSRLPAVSRTQAVQQLVLPFPRRFLEQPEQLGHRAVLPPHPAVLAQHGPKPGGAVQRARSGLGKRCLRPRFERRRLYIPSSFVRHSCEKERDAERA